MIHSISDRGISLIKPAPIFGELGQNMWGVELMIMITAYG